MTTGAPAWCGKFAGVAALLSGGAARAGFCVGGQLVVKYPKQKFHPRPV
jgi:hypothetical protein